MSGSASIATSIALTLLACASQQVVDPDPPGIIASTADTTPLRTLAARRNIGIGSVGDRGFRTTGTPGSQFRTTLAREFDVLTPENDLKFARMQPTRGVFTFAWGDSILAFAQANGMRMRGHTLVWHRQISPWVTGGTWTQDEAKAIMRDHIMNVAGHYRGRLAAWDVVNEAVDEDGSMRSSFWSRNVGDDYIDLAFRWAREADPVVPLFYNDYNTEGFNAKSDAVYALARGLKERGVPIDGVGFQAHFTAGGLPSKADLLANVARFAALGLKVHITELDIRIRQPSTPDQLLQQAADYRRVAEVCLETPACEMIVIWGVSDADSWVPASFPGWGEALLFDTQYRPKPAYYELQQTLSGK
jgi:endo-1,4-beta-xylanase